MSRRISYALSGADRFQLYFDAVARKNTGIGNVIRAVVTLEGTVPTSEILHALKNDKAMNILRGLALKRNFFLGDCRIESATNQASPEIKLNLMTFQEAMSLIASKDCDFLKGTPLHADVAYSDKGTHLILSVNHVIMDHAGMEILLSSLAGEDSLIDFAESNSKKTFTSKLTEAIAATRHVSSLSSWSMKRLADKREKGSAAFELVELSPEETELVKKNMTIKLKANQLAFFLGCSMFSISKHSELLTGKNYFVPVPVDRRTASSQNSLLSNFISFLYFKAEESDLESLEKITGVISKQTIMQAKKNIPEKFSSLLDLFRHVPSPLYKAFIDLPSRGHAATFAFSLLSGSKLEGKKILGRRVLDVTHYAPVISPPGLNVIFSEFNSKLKILCSFDERRISRKNILAYLDTIKQNLLG